MKNQELWKQYEDYTKELTGNARKLAFAAAAICWFFKASDDKFPTLILFALSFVVLFFMADILQFFCGALMLRLWTRKQEKLKHKKTGTIEGDYDKPAWLDHPSFGLWCLKIIALFLSFLFIGLHLLP